MSTVITNDEAKERIGVNVSRYMVEKNMSQAELSRITGESEMTISQIVRSKHVPNSAILHRIAEALQVKMDELVAPIQAMVNGHRRRAKKTA